MLAQEIIGVEDRPLTQLSLWERSKRLLIAWLQSPSTVILEPKKMKSVPAPIRVEPL